jgi:hypothetical protein
MAELLQSLSKVQCHPNYGSFEFTITDFLEAESIEFNESDMMLYGAHAIGGEFVNRKLVVGIVVTDPEVIALLKLRYEPLVHYSVGYFPTLKECKSWIEEKSPTMSLFSRSGN